MVFSLSGNAKKGLCRPKYTTNILLSLKRNVSQTLKCNSLKNVFPKYYIIDTMIQLGFYTNLSLSRGLVQPPCCCVFWLKSTFCIRYLHNNITMLLISKAHNKASTSSMLLTKVICFLIFQFVNSSHFSL